MVCINTSRKLDRDLLQGLLYPVDREAIIVQLWEYEYFRDIVDALTVDISEKNCTAVWNKVKMYSERWWDSIYKMNIESSESSNLLVIPDMTTATVNEIDDISAYMFGYFCASKKDDNFAVHLANDVFFENSELWYENVLHKADVVADATNTELFGIEKPVYIHQDCNNSAVLGLMNIIPPKGMRDGAHWKSHSYNIYNLITGFWGNLKRDYGDESVLSILEKVKRDMHYTLALKSLVKG